MLRASHVEILLTPEDLKQITASYAAGDVSDLDIELHPGEAVVRHRVVSEKLPVAVPVELRFRIRSVDRTTVVAEVEWSNLPLLPGFLKEYALQKAFEPLPGRYEDGLFTVDLGKILDEMPVSFALDQVEIGADGIRVGLRDLVVYPFRAGEEVLPPAVIPVPSQEEAEIPEHQEYYRQFRERVKRFAAEKAPRWVQPLVPWILAAPDFFVLVVRLARDERVPSVAKVLAALTVAYFILPLDLIPDLLSVVGVADDLALALFALDQIVDRIPAEVVEEHWPGEGRVLELIREGVRLFTKVLPAQTVAAIRRVLAKGSR